MDKTLVLFTSSFPYGKGEYYLETEIPYLQKQFSRIIVLPARIPSPLRPVVDGLTIETALAKTRLPAAQRAIQSALKSMVSPYFYTELNKRPQSLIQPRALAHIISHLGDALRVYGWLKSYIAEADLDLNNTVFYTYWLGRPTLALAWLKKEHPELKLVSRAHGVDLYAERHIPPYIPFRLPTLHATQLIYTDGLDGRDYLVERYPFLEGRCFAGAFAANDPGFTTPPSTDGVLHVISCSNMVAVKRIHLLIDGLKHFVQKHPEQRIHWHHIGDGPLQSQLQSQAQSLPATVQWQFHGRMSNQEVIQFYQEHPLDVFVNISESEGLPMSIIEALSCGIPVLATAAGGTPEMVNTDTGYLLPVDSTASLIGESLALFLGDQSAKRNAAKQMWANNYDAQKRYTQFTASLVALIRNI